MQVDVMGPYEEFLADMAVDIIAKAEELDPPDHPGQLSGANLILGGFRDEATIHAGFGRHTFGLIGGTPLFRFVSASLDLLDGQPPGNQVCVVDLAAFQPVIDGALTPFHLEVSAQPDPMLKIMAGVHCFGVIQGQALRQFLEATLARGVFGKAVPTEVLAGAREAIDACLNPLQDLGRVRMQ
jgi:hypothetical protein